MYKIIIYLGENSFEYIQNLFKTSEEYLFILNEFGDIYNSEFRNILNQQPRMLVSYISQFFMVFKINFNTTLLETDIDLGKNKDLNYLSDKLILIKFFLNKILLSIEWNRNDNNNYIGVKYGQI